MHYPANITEQKAHEWAFSPDWEPSTANETRKEQIERLSSIPYQWCDKREWNIKMSLMTAEERFESWKRCQEALDWAAWDVLIINVDGVKVRGTYRQVVGYVEIKMHAPYAAQWRVQYALQKYWGLVVRHNRCPYWRARLSLELVYRKMKSVEEHKGKGRAAEAFNYPDIEI
jgi:hypothetical protein